MTLRVGVVVCHHRNPAVADTLTALARQTVPPARVVVVENASGPGWAARIRRAAPWADVVEAGANRGYAAAVNLGLAALAGENLDAVAFATHEVEPAPDALATLADRLAAEPGVGVVGPLLVWRSDPERVWSAGGVIEARTARPAHRNEPAAAAAWRGMPPVEADWLDGAFVLARREVLDDVGGIDESYFLYFEEVDWCLRVRRAGWRIECVPAAVVAQESAGVPVYLAYRNRLLLARRAAPRRVLPEALHLARTLAGHLLAGRAAAVVPGARGLVAGLVGRGGPPPPGSLAVRLDPDWRRGLRLRRAGEPA